jgi:hypothetical protein
MGLREGPAKRGCNNGGDNNNGGGVLGLGRLHSKTQIKLFSYPHRPIFFVLFFSSSLQSEIAILGFTEGGGGGSNGDGAVKGRRRDTVVEDYENLGFFHFWFLGLSCFGFFCLYSLYRRFCIMEIRN